MRYMFIVVLLAIVVGCFAYQPVSAQELSMNDYSGLEVQFKVNTKPENELNFGYGFTGFARLVGIKAISANFEQYYAMVSVRKGYFYASVGNIGNWRGTDPLLVGLATEYPFGPACEFGQRFLFVSEFFYIRKPIGSGTDFKDAFNWTSLEYNFSWDGKPAWIGIHADTFNEDLTYTKAGVHFGYNVWESDFFVGDKGWNWRVLYNFYI